MIIVTDIDHTVSDAAWRDPLIGRWDEYYLAGKDDKPIDFVVLLLQLMSKVTDCEIVAITGRPERWRDLTTRWLIEQNVPVDRLYMRPDYDTRPTHILKVDIFMSHFDVRDVFFVLEDNDRATAAYQDIGLNVFTVNPGRK